MWKLATLLLFLGSASATCVTRKIKDVEICTCNATYCDTVPKIGGFTKSELKIYETSRTKLGFNFWQGNSEDLTSVKDATTTINVDASVKYQTISGFGGVFTDAAGQNINRLTKAAQQKLLESYFGEDGIEYSLCRVPLGGSDFSPRPYSYDDFDGDNSLEKFSLQKEDFLYKIPYIKQALKLTNNKLKLMTTPWTAPPWMKDHHIWAGYSLLSENHFQTWADYIIKFFDEYEKLGIKFWGMTTGNEPLNGFFNTKRNLINCMGWIPEVQARWIRDNLGPTLRNSSHKDIKLMIHDDSLETLPFFVPLLIHDEKVLKYIDGIATHWYDDTTVSHEVINLARTDKKDLFLLASESCFFMAGPSIGNWSRAQYLADSIIEHLGQGYVGWVDWNMVLNMTGGFTYIDYLADAPVIVSDDGSEFYKQPIFYTLGHFSKFIIPGSVRIKSSVDNENVKVVAFLRPDDIKVLVISNSQETRVTAKLDYVSKSPVIFEIPAESVVTVLSK